jgi:MerR family transcriptional regulator/heat shock protein HspR
MVFFSSKEIELKELHVSEKDDILFSGKSMKRGKGFFSISAVAKMFSIHQQTIRLYEREGLITPKRSDGNTRLFSEEDVDRLEEVIFLTHKLGINLAGVQMVLKLQKQIRKMQKDMNQIFDTTHENLAKEETLHKTQARLAAQELATLKQKVEPESNSSDNTTVADDNWEWPDRRLFFNTWFSYVLLLVLVLE